MKNLTANSFEYQTIQSQTGKLWLDRNIGALSPTKNITDNKDTGYFFSLLTEQHLLLDSIPEGFHLPSAEEWHEEITTWRTQDNEHPKNLNLPYPGHYVGSRMIYEQGTQYYWVKSESEKMLMTVYDIKQNKTISVPLFSEHRCVARCIQDAY